MSNDIVMVKYSTQKMLWIKQYPFLLPLIALCAGIALQRFCADVNVYIWLITFGFSTLSFFVFHVVHTAHRLIAVVRLAVAVFAFLFLGTLLSFYQNVKSDNNWYGHFLPRSDALLVKVSSDMAPKEKTNCWQVNVEQIHVDNHWLKVHGVIKMYVYRNDSAPAYHIDQSLLLPVNELSEIKNSGNPFGFNFAAYAQRNGLFHQAFLNHKDITIYDNSLQQGDVVLASKRTLMGAIRNNVKDSVTRSLIEATLLNERASLDDDLWKAYSVTGIVHIIAISGTHVMMLCGILMFLLTWIKHKKLEWLKYLVAVALVWYYIALTNFPPSAVRAAAMFTLMAVGIKLNRHINSINTWAAAAFLLLCYNPYWLYDVGVQLSFLAVLSILVFYAPVRLWVKPSNKILRFLWDGIAISVAAQILVFPLALYYFHQFPLLSVVANIPAAIYSFLLMTGSLLLFFIDSIGLPAVWLGQLITWLTQGFHVIVMALANITPSAMQHLYIDTVDFLLMMLAIVLFSLFCFKKGNAFLLSGLATTCMLILSFIIQDLNAAKQKRIVAYNAPKLSLVDVFNGKSVSSLGDSVDLLIDKAAKYSLLPARLGYRAMKPLAARPDNLQLISNAKVLYWNENLMLNSDEKFAVDYLIVGSMAPFQPQVWQSIFSPKLIIIDGSLPRWKAIKWKDEMELLGIKVHWVGEDGAWVFPQ